jgi:cysteine synthase
MRIALKQRGFLLATLAQDHDTTTRIESLRAAVGNTPMFAIRFRYSAGSSNECVRTVYAKAEHFNLTGSIKDRMALHILQCAYATGAIHPDGTIVEATSGNTGIAFASLGRALGHRVRIYMPDWMSRERVDLIRSYGAEIILVSKEQGGFLGSIAMARAEAKADPNCFLPKQFANVANVEAHATTTGPEILRQLARIGLVPDAFVAGVGTGGTVMGVARALRLENPAVHVHPVEPAESPTLTTGYKVGSHRIQGISDEFIPEIVRLAELDSVIAIPDGDSILMARKLASDLGLAVGISSGCNFLAAVRVAIAMGEDAVVTTIFADDNKKYLSTCLLRDEPVREDYQSEAIELLDFRMVQRS